MMVLVLEPLPAPTKLMDEPPVVERATAVFAVDEEGRFTVTLPVGAVKLMSELPVALIAAPSPKLMVLALTVNLAPLSISWAAPLKAIVDVPVVVMDKVPAVAAEFTLTA